MRPLNPPRRLLMGSGPSNPEPRVLQALAASPPPPHSPAFLALLDDVARLGRRVFQTHNPLAFALPGASRAGIEAAIASLIEPGDRVVVGVYGHFGELLCTLATRYGAVVVRVEAEWGRAIDPGAMLDAVARAHPRLVAIVHADTSTGIVQPLAEIGRGCRQAGALFLVDTVLSIGGCEVDVDAWCIDAAIGGLQKCLGGPPGMALLTLSEAARSALASRAARSAGPAPSARAVQRHPPPPALLDVAAHAAAWLEHADLEHYETSGSMLLAMREALELVHTEGLPARWNRHALASRALRSGLRGMGLEVFADPAHRVPMITLVPVPDGIPEQAVREQLLEQHGIEIMAAFGPLRGRVWRIGSMGTNACLPSVLAVLAALENVLATHGWSAPRGSAVEAALAEYATPVADPDR